MKLQSAEICFHGMLLEHKWILLGSCFEFATFSDFEIKPNIYICLLLNHFIAAIRVRDIIYCAIFESWCQMVIPVKT